MCWRVCSEIRRQDPDLSPAHRCNQRDSSLVERYDRDLKDLFVLQDEIARQIMTALQVKLTEGEHASGVAGTTSNLKALECFWRSEEHFFRFTREDNAAARQWAQKSR